MSAHKPNPTWTDVKTQLSNFDHAGLISLVQDLYAARKDTRSFLHVRLAALLDAHGIAWRLPPFLVRAGGVGDFALRSWCACLGVALLRIWDKRQRG